MSHNRTYYSKLNDKEQVKVTWLDGAQRCSLVTNEDVNKSDIKLPRSKEDQAEVIVGPTEKRTYKQLREEVIKGNTVYNRQGKKIPCTKMAERTPDKVTKVSIRKEGKQTVYYIQ